MRTFIVLAWATMLTGAATATAMAQAVNLRPLRGTVTDVETTLPVAAAQIHVSGTRYGTVTANDGRFDFQVPEGAITIEVRRIGYQPITVKVAADQNDLSIKLKADVLQLSQEVITGQATTISRANSANDVAVVGGTALNEAHAPTLDNALRGKAAGVEITQNSGAPGGGLQIRMRGVTSIFGNSEPLYVVDGLPVSNTVTPNGLNTITQGGSDAQDNSVNRIADLNPNDIQDIEILKGPSAAAIYGSEAANGVVVITTKRGTVGKPHFSFTQQFGTNTLEHKLGLRQWTLSDAEAAYPTISPDTLSAWFQDDGGFHDFEQEVYGDRSLSWSSNLSMSGGNQNTQYFMSGLSMHDNGIQYGTGYDKQSVRANVTQLVGNKLQIQLNTNLIHTLTRRGISNNDNVNVSPYVVFSATPTFFDFRPVGGVYPKNPFLSNSSNPLQTIALFQNPEDVFRFLGSLDAQYTAFTTATQTLKATLDLSIDHYNYDASLYSPPTLYYEPADGFPGTTQDGTTAETRAPVAVTLAHTYTSPSNSIQATTSAGIRRGYDDVNQVTVTTTDLLAGQQNIDRGANVGATQNRQLVRTFAWYAQEDLLLFDQRLFLSGGILGQKSTNNADVNKLFYYPKVAASYRLGDIGPFNELKLRAAFGQTGNEPLYAQKFSTLAPSVIIGLNAQQLGTVVASSDLHPERESEIEVGADAGLFKSRVALNLTLYQKTNSDLLLQAALAPSTGFSTRFYNAGQIRNRGGEASASYYAIQKKDVSWMTRLTFSRNVGRVTELPVPGFAPPGAFSLAFGEGFVQQGASPSQIVGVVNGVQTTLGDYEPDFVMGWSNEVNVGPFRFFGLVDWRDGGYAVNLTQLLFDADGLSPDVADANTRVAAQFAKNATSQYIQPTSFAKLRELTVSYRLPTSLVQSALGKDVSGARLEVSGRNLFTWTHYQGLDPEVSNFGDQNINRSQDVAPYPPSRTFMFTLGVDF